jgi:hypothetical protein
MITTLRALTLCVIYLAVTGCVSGPRWDLTAAPIKAATCQTGTSPKIAVCAVGNSELAKVHDLVQDSQQKCQEFKDGLFSQLAATNTSLDILGTAFSAAGTVFKSLTTVHALSAGNTLATGARSSIQSEYLTSQSISHVIQAIQSTYDVKMQAYLAYLRAVKAPNAVDVTVERSTINSYHSLCSLAAANASIDSSLHAPNVAKPPSQLSTTYTVQVSDTNSNTLAASIASHINADSSFSGAGVTASNNGDVVTITSKTLAISWKHTDFVPAKGQTQAAEKAEFTDGSPTTVKITATTPRENDALTLESSAIAQKSTTSPPVQAPPAPTKLTLTYTVLGTEKNAADLATQLSKRINADPNFKQAALSTIAAPVNSNGVIYLTVPSGATVVWEPHDFSPAAGKSKSETAAFSDGPPPTLEISGKPQKGDKLVVTASLTKGITKQPPAHGVPVEAPVELPVAEAPPAAIGGQPVSQQ